MGFQSDASISGSPGVLGMHEVDDFLHFAATLIQSSFRGYLQRKPYIQLVSFFKLVCIS
jgi:hypothetical protein